MAKIKRTITPKAKPRPKESPLIKTVFDLRKDTAYGTARVMLGIVAVLNVFLCLIYATTIEIDPAIQVFTAISLIIGTILFHQIFSALLDIADSNLEKLHRLSTAEKAQNTQNMYPQQVQPWEQ